MQKKAIADNKAHSPVTVRKGAGLIEGMIAIARSKEGIMGLYRGFGASMVNTFSTRESICERKWTSEC